MIQFNIEYLKDNKNIGYIVEKALPILNKRKELYDKYKKSKTNIFNNNCGCNNNKIYVPLEYYITNIISGYFGGKEPQYIVKQENDDKKKEIINRIFDKKIGENANLDEFQTIIDYIKDYNDNASFFYDLVQDYVITGGGYGLIYQTQKEEQEEYEIVYANVSSLNTVAIYDYSVPKQMIGLLRIWNELDDNGNEIYSVELITDKQKKYFKNSKKEPLEYVEDINMAKKVEWSLVPAVAVETKDGLGLFERVLELIYTLEEELTNNRDNFAYNNDAKLKITGYFPKEPHLVQAVDNEGKPKFDKTGSPLMVSNPARQLEDEMVLQAPVFYTDKEGDIDWIIKQIDNTASSEFMKQLIDLILMTICVPNVTDTGFTNADNASAIDRKFFPLEQVLTQADKTFKKELLRMWEIIMNRINFLKTTNFDFREIEVRLQRNTPLDKADIVDTALKLQGLVSDETVISLLPYEFDVETELSKMNNEETDNITANISKIKGLKEIDANTEDIDDDESTDNI